MSGTNFARYHTQSPGESKYYHFRINDLGEEQLNMLKEVDCEWIVIGEVENEADKGVHYHCAIKFKRSLTHGSALKKLLWNKDLINDKDYYIETKYTKADVKQFINYVIKNGVRFDTTPGLVTEEEPAMLEGNTVVEQFIAKTMSKAELNKLRVEKARAGDEEWFLENDFQFMLGNQYSKLVMFVQPHCEEILQGDLENYWVWGKSGTCKSASIHHVWPDAYSKVCSNEKWDNYSNTKPGHKVVHIEEVDDFTDIEKGMEGLAGLKRMADRYPFPVRFNYGSRNLMIRPKTIVITSNFSPSQILSNPDKRGNITPNLEIQLQAIQRKFKVLHIDQFKKLFKLVDKVDETGKLIGVMDQVDLPSPLVVPLAEGELRAKEREERMNMNMEDARYWGEDEA